jgi:hypothetical protein
LAHPTQCKSTNKTNGDGGFGSSFFASSAGFSSFFSSTFSSFFSSGLASALACSYQFITKHDHINEQDSSPQNFSKTKNNTKNHAWIEHIYIYIYLMISYLLSFFPHLHKQLKQTSS